MGDNIDNDDWKAVVTTTYEVVKDVIGRGGAFDKTIVDTLGISAEYEVRKM